LEKGGRDMTTCGNIHVEEYVKKLNADEKILMKVWTTNIDSEITP
jgi:hypothetical protein